MKKVTKINLRVISKYHAHLKSLTKTPVKFQKDWDKIVGEVALTRYLMSINFSSSIAQKLLSSNCEKSDKN